MQATLPASYAPPRASCPHVDASLIPWNTPSLWGGAPPLAAGEDVSLPPGASILLSACHAPASGVLTFGKLVIPAGTRLVLGDSPLALVAASIVVRGALAAGSPSCRLRSAINITLTGSRPAPLPSASLASDPYAKGIVVEGGGSLDLHGELFSPTWTRLAAPAAAGDTWVYLQHAVNWEIGQTFIVTTTALKDSRAYSETEERVIHHAVTLPSGGAALHFLTPLLYFHYSGPEYQAEVGLLSRRLTVAGSAWDSPPTDPLPAECPAPPAYAPYFTGKIPCSNTSLTGFGGHIMVMGQGAGRLSGVLLLRMGQTNYLARYPFHLHLLNASGPASFITDSSIWRSYYRCVSIHGTSGSLVSANVAHDVTGHCYYLENGVEELNTFSFNLASSVHPLFDGASNFFPASGPGASQEFAANIFASPTLVLPADSTASGFYITNAYNRFIGNAASGGWSGFAFPSLATGIGEHRFYTAPGDKKLFNPVARPTLEFRGNSAHSSGYWWGAAGCIYVGGSLSYASSTDPAAPLVYNPGRSNTFNPSGASVSHGLTQFNDTLLFLCNVGLQHWGSLPQLFGLETHDVIKAANFFGLAIADTWTVTCRTANRPTFASPGSGSGWQEQAWRQSSSLFQSYDTGQSHLINNLTFRNCTSVKKKQEFQLLEMLTHSDTFSPDTMIISQNLSFEGVGMDASQEYRLGVTVNATPPTVSHRMQNWGDADGSLSGRPGIPTQLGSSRMGWWWRLDDRCVNRMDWTMWVCDSPPRRSSGMVYLLFNRTAQLAPPSGVLGTEVCSNGNYKTIPCPAIGSVWHLGYLPSSGMDLPLNAKLSGPVGGFGWVVGGAQWRAPLVLNLTSPQCDSDKALLLVLPYPPGSRFRVTAYSASVLASPGAALPSWCFVKDRAGAVLASNLCAMELQPVASVKEVRARGDGYFFDATSNHLYIRVIAFKDYSFLGVPNFTTSASGARVAGLGRVWGVDATFTGLQHRGMQLPPRGGNFYSIVTDCGGVGNVAPDGMFCSTPQGNGGAQPASPCPADVALPLTDFDSCQVGGAGWGSGGGAGQSDSSSPSAQAGGGAQEAAGAARAGIIAGISLAGIAAVVGLGAVAHRVARGRRAGGGKVLHSSAARPTPARPASARFKVGQLVKLAK